MLKQFRADKYFSKVLFNQLSYLFIGMFPSGPYD